MGRDSAGWPSSADPEARPLDSVILRGLGVLPLAFFALKNTLYEALAKPLRGVCKGEFRIQESEFV